jgi:hypothetical protein
MGISERAQAHNLLIMSPWKLLTSNDGSGCFIHKGSICWMHMHGSEYNATGAVEIQHVPKAPGLFRIFIDGTLAIWNNETGTKERGPPIKHCIYLPTDGGLWTTNTCKKKSSSHPDYRVYAMKVQFHPNKDGLSFLQVCAEVLGNDTSDGERFAQALLHANTSFERVTATNADTTV